MDRDMMKQYEYTSEFVFNKLQKKKTLQFQVSEDYLVESQIIISQGRNFNLKNIIKRIINKQATQRKFQNIKIFDYFQRRQEE